MGKVLRIVPMVCIVAFMSTGERSSFDVAAMRIPALIGFAVVLFVASPLTREATSPVVKAFAVFLGLEALILWLMPGPFQGILARHCTETLYIILCSMAVIPPLIGKDPFTLFFAKRETPPEFWDTDIFRTINRHLSFFWAVLFVHCATAAMISHLTVFDGSRLAPLLLRLLGPIMLLLGVGRSLNKWYPGHYMRKLGLTPPSE